MARYYSPITKGDFLKKIEILFAPGVLPGMAPEDSEYPYNLPTNITKDLGKVEFDWENFYAFDDEPRPNILEGYREIAVGFHVFFAWAGGDWAFPVTFIFYNSDKGIRAYIPAEGNTWNKKTKSAYDGDDEDIPEIDEEKMFADILKRIVLR